jgi:segregation and condensation protein A
MTAAPAISLPRFDGPLDLLLSLIRKNEFDINDIPVAAITRQYLDYMNAADSMDIDLGSDFVYLAATLIQIKSRCLLPVDPEVAAREPDPREELVRQLISHDQVRNAAEFLHERFEVANASWSRRPVPRKTEEFVEFDGPEMTDPGTMNLFEVLQLAKKALETARTHQILRLEEERVTVEQMVAWLSRKLAEHPFANPLPSEILFREQSDLSREIALFLAMLEMSRRGELDLEQASEFGPIYLWRSDMAHSCRNVE